MTTSGKAPEQPGPRRQADGRLVPDPRPGDRDMREMKDPYDLPFPDLFDCRPASHPTFVIVVDQLRDWQPGQPPSLAELLETRSLTGYSWLVRGVFGDTPHGVRDC